MSGAGQNQYMGFSPLANEIGFLFINPASCSPSEPVHMLQIHGSADTSAPNLELIPALAGAETTVARYTDGCQAGGSGELWTMVDGTHAPVPLSSGYARRVVEYLYAHPEPAARPR